MASSINASTSGAGGIITTADNSGILQLKSAGTTIATVSSTGLALNAGNITLPSGAAPAFSAYRTTNQSITTNTFTKILWTAEEFDTNNNFASSAFTPTVAGYYLIVAGYNPNGGGTPSRCILDIFKNGNQIKRVFDTSARCDDASGSCLVYMNGTTDYVEAYAYIIATSPQIYSSQSDTYFQGFLARSA